MLRRASTTVRVISCARYSALTWFPPLVFAGKEPNRALARSSLKTEDCIAEWENLDDKEKQVLADWYTFFSKRYNIVGKLQPEGGANL
jgi:hypothetical protein